MEDGPLAGLGSAWLAEGCPWMGCTGGEVATEAEQALPAWFPGGTTDDTEKNARPSVSG